MIFVLKPKQGNYVQYVKSKSWNVESESEMQWERGHFLQADVPRQTIATVKQGHSSLLDSMDPKHQEYASYHYSS